MSIPDFLAGQVGHRPHIVRGSRRSFARKSGARARSRFYSVTGRAGRIDLGGIMEITMGVYRDPVQEVYQGGLIVLA